mmetsp:Transcript_26572/g.76747  ORF Transcript_26572/g.76747 Transcript_26572/m.76747 type:complete len:203 (-) Transcript_26572:513-1121(-)
MLRSSSSAKVASIEDCNAAPSSREFDGFVGAVLAGALGGAEGRAGGGAFLLAAAGAGGGPPGPPGPLPARPLMRKVFTNPLRLGSRLARAARLLPPGSRASSRASPSISLMARIRSSANLASLELRYESFCRWTWTKYLSAATTSPSARHSTVSAAKARAREMVAKPSAPTRAVAAPAAYSAEGYSPYRTSLKHALYTVSCA